MAHFIGTPTRDVYQGGAGDDLIEGLQGSDLLRGGGGNDTVYGGNDRDEIYGEGGNDLLHGDGGNDVIFGGGGNDVAYGGTGYDELNGGGGSDRLYGGDGIDTINGGDGNDYLESGGKDSAPDYHDDRFDTLDGGAGADTMVGTAWREIYYVDNIGDVIVEGSEGNNDVAHASISYTLAANVENLILDGSAPLDGWGNAIDNRISGNNSNNRLYGMDGDDYLFGNGGADRLEGGAGDDHLNGDAGADRLIGGAGYDIYVVDNVNDVVEDSDAMGEVRSYIDWDLDWSAGLHELWLWNYDDDINAWGTDQADHIRGTLGTNIIHGGGGDDQLYGESGRAAGAGRDFLYGEEGNDLLTDWGFGDYPADDGGLPDELYGGVGDDTYQTQNPDAIHELVGEGNDTWMFTESGSDDVYSVTLMENVENLIFRGRDWFHYGGYGNELDNRMEGVGGQYMRDGFYEFHGLAGNDVLIGGDDNDTLYGGVGNDVLDGGIAESGDDNDTLTGGEGADVFVLHHWQSPWGDGVDTVADFEHGIDAIRLDDAEFRNMGGPGDLRAVRFHLGTEATDARHRLIFDDSTGALYYDRDGTGAQAQIHIADITVVSGALDHSDFAIV